MSLPVRPRVLLIAEAANPEWVSVPLVGWSLAKALSAVADVHIVTQIRNREAFLRAGLTEGKDFTAIDSERLAKPMWKLGTALAGDARLGWTIQQAVQTLSYPYFERLVWKQFGQSIRARKFDIVHRVTPLSPVQQSPIAAKCRAAGVPFVLGPLNGGVPWPKGFESEMRREREWLSKLRGAYRALPGRRATLRADAILAGSRHTLQEIPAPHAERAIYLPENAVDPARFWRRADHASFLNGGPMRACFIGRLVPYKGADMLIEAAAPLLSSGRMTIDVIGDGPARDALDAMAARFGASVQIHGWKAHNEVQDIAASCNVLSFPSIREFGGGVVLEAMALGLCPIIVDYAGPGELVTEDTGWKVPIGTRAEVVSRFHAALEEALSDPQEVVRRATAARRRVDELFTWERKAGQILAVYDWVLNKADQKPQFF